MTLHQLHELRLWHLSHVREHPLETQTWDMVLTFWLAGCAGAPAALLTHAAWALGVCSALFFLPGGYVRLRRRLHAMRVLRCDWIDTLRR